MTTDEYTLGVVPSVPSAPVLTRRVTVRGTSSDANVKVASRMAGEAARDHAGDIGAGKGDLMAWTVTDISRGRIVARGSVLA